MIIYNQIKACLLNLKKGGIPMQQKCGMLINNVNNVKRWFYEKIMSILLSIVMSTSLVIPTFAEAPPYSIDKVATKVVIDQHELRDIYDKYASVTDETVVEDMLMEDFGFSRSEVKELLEVSKSGSGGSTGASRASSITGRLPATAAIGTVVNIVYTIDLQEMKDLATITNFIARQVGGAGAGVAVAALVAKTVLAAAQKGGINYAKVTISYTYGYNNDGVLGWTPGYTKYEYW